MVLILVENTHRSNTLLLCNLSYIRIWNMECRFTRSCSLPVYLLSAYPVDDPVYGPFMLLFICYLHYCGALVLNYDINYISYKYVISFLLDICLTFIPQVQAFSLLPFLWFSLGFLQMCNDLDTYDSLFTGHSNLSCREVSGSSDKVDPWLVLPLRFSSTWLGSATGSYRLWCSYLILSCLILCLIL